MDTFEKQQRVDSIRGIVKARWINIAIIIALGFVLRTKYYGNWATGFEYLKMVILGLFAFGYNAIYWLYIRRPIEKISDKGLTLVTLFQVAVDQILYTLVFYYSGTIESVAFVLYFITILIASSLYKTRGVILTGLFAAFLHDGIILAEYYKLIPHISAYPGTMWFGNIFVTRGRMTGPVFYLAVAVVFSIVLSALFREKIIMLRKQRDELEQKSKILDSKTQELSKTKDYLHEALTKSDAARVEVEKTKGELEKANLELKAKLNELEKYGRVTTGRELKMIELKDKIKTLEKRIEELEKNRI